MSTPSWKEHFQTIVTGYDPVEAQGLSELGFAVINQKIDEQEYLSWARLTYEMQSLDVNFFQKIAPPIALISKLREVYPWGPEIMPVAEWDGHTLILALEKPQTPLPPELLPIVLLAPISKMSELWQVTIAALEESSEVALEIEPAIEVLEGINLEPSTSVTSLDFSNLRTTTVISEKPVDIPTKIDIEPAAITFEPEVTKTPVKASPQVISVISSKGDLDQTKIKNCLSHYKHIYENRCFIKVEAKTKTFQVTVWPEESNMTTVPSQHDLNSDSFIKIVVQTQKPYHGHVIKTLIADKFFKEVHAGQIPENATAIPLIKDGEVVGIIAGWGPSTTYNMQTLRELENIVQNLCVELGFTAVDSAA